MPSESLCLLLPHKEVLPMSFTCCPFSSLLWKGHPVTVRRLKTPETHPDVLLADLQHCRLPGPADHRFQQSITKRMWDCHSCS